MKTTNRFHPSTDRYAFDFGVCSYQNGYAQIDSGQDASYYGNWANPTTRTLVCYAEGDITIKECETDIEFEKALRELCQWCEEHTGLGKIDPGFNADIKFAFHRLGCHQLMH